MASFLEGFAAQAFNGKIAADMEVERLTQDMLQAVYRREHATVDHLAAKGAKFSGEMLQAALGFQDTALTLKCLEAGVLPTEAMVRTAIDKHSAPLTDMLLKKTTISPELRDYAARFGTDDVRRVVQRTGSLFAPELREL
jgi:hypothetical protein